MLPGMNSSRLPPGRVPDIMEARICKENPDDKLGEIQVRGENVMTGYYKTHEATKEVFTEDGWFRTGDLGEFSADGWLYIKGRLKNMIVGPSGENIYPEDIESVLNSHVCVADSVVTEHEGRLVALVHFQYRRSRSQVRRLEGGFRELEGESQEGGRRLCEFQGQSFLAYLRGRGGEAGVRQDSDAEDPTFPLYQAQPSPETRNVQTIGVCMQL